MLNKHNLALAKLANREESRFTLNGILVTPKETVVTDGHHLTKVTLPDTHPESFPDVPQVQGKPTLEFSPFVLSTLDALDILKNLPKKPGIPVLQHAAVFGQTFQKGCAKCHVEREDHGPLDGKERDHEFQESDRVDRTTLVVTDLERPRPYFAKAPNGNFPDHERVLPERSRNIFEIGISPRLLLKVLHAHAALWEDSPAAMCVLSFEDPAKAMQIFSEVNGQQMVSVVMPMRDPPVQNAGFERRKKLQQAAMNFKVAIDERVQKGGHVFIEAASARFYDDVREIFAEKEPEVQTPVEAKSEAEVVPEIGASETASGAGVDSGDSELRVYDEEENEDQGLEEVEYGEFETDQKHAEEIEAAKQRLAEKHFACQKTAGKTLAQRRADIDLYDEVVNQIAGQFGEEVATELVDEVAALPEPEAEADPICPAKQRLQECYLATRQVGGKTLAKRISDRDVYNEEVDRFTRDLGEEVVLQILDEIEQDVAPVAPGVLPGVTKAEKAAAEPAGSKFTMSYGSTPVGSFTVPDPAPKPVVVSGGPFTGRMMRADTLDQAQVIMEEFEKRINALERSEGLVPSVGEGARGLAYVGWPLLTTQDRTDMLTRVKGEKRQQLDQLVTDGLAMLAAYRSIQTQAQDAMRARFGSPAPKTSGNTALASKPAVAPVSGVRPDRPEDWNTMSAGKKAAWTRKYGKY